MKDINNCLEKKKEDVLIIDELLSEYEKGLLLINRNVEKLNKLTNYVVGLDTDEDEQSSSSDANSNHGYFQFEILNNKIFVLNDKLEKIISRFYK